MMRKLILPVIILSLICLSCSKKVHPAKPVVVQKKGDDTTYVAFTKSLKQRIGSSNIDLRKIQFFVDQKLVLRRTLGSDKAEVESGVILFEKGSYINEIVIPAYTPGICEVVNGDRLQISFEKQGNALEFAALNENIYFKLTGTHWDNINGSADVNYENNVYRISCASCSSAGQAKLVVIKKEIDNLQQMQRVVEGRKVTDN